MNGGSGGPYHLPTKVLIISPGGSTTGTSGSSGAGGGFTGSNGLGLLGIGTV